ncbi:DM13 domain-containing protein [Paraconexibacter algicola]|uniref:DM13 domain-containing protein n=1 Tax=Paraconexibacter algicola TaxID=2133960 RepID=A0A2T4UGQ6_9ACTN|nr:DM13 domain-containing protein [Paraconexibacter algicola]PTL58434.1 hypothetical protein C7Y72_01585 [Paraconexibacter algicola]
MPRSRPALLATAATAVALLSAAPPAMAANVELLRGTVRPASHDARGVATVVARPDGSRTLNLRRFRIDPGPVVRVWLVPKSARSDGRIDDDYKDLGRLKGSKGNQSYRIPKSIDLRRYSSVVFWCVPFTSNLARADLGRS